MLRNPSKYRSILLAFVAVATAIAQDLPGPNPSIRPKNDDSITGMLRFYEKRANGTNYFGIQARDSMTANVVVRWPSIAPTANQTFVVGTQLGDGSWPLNWGSGGAGGWPVGDDIFAVYQNTPDRPNLGDTPDNTKTAMVDLSSLATGQQTTFALWDVINTFSVNQRISQGNLGIGVPLVYLTDSASPLRQPINFDGPSTEGQGLAVRGTGTRGNIDLSTAATPTAENQVAAITYTGYPFDLNPTVTDPNKQRLGLWRTRFCGTVTSDFGGCQDFWTKGDGGSLTARLRLDQNGDILLLSPVGTPTQGAALKLRTYLQTTTSMNLAKNNNQIAMFEDDARPSVMYTWALNTRQIDLKDHSGVPGSLNWGMLANVDLTGTSSNFRLQDNSGYGVLYAVRSFAGSTVHSLLVDMNLVPNNEAVAYTTVGSGSPPTGYKVGAWSVGTNALHWLDGYFESLHVGTLQGTVRVNGALTSTGGIMGTSYSLWDGSNPLSASTVVDSGQQGRFASIFPLTNNVGTLGSNILRWNKLFVTDLDCSGTCSLSFPIIRTSGTYPVGIITQVSDSLIRIGINEPSIATQNTAAQGGDISIDARAGENLFQWLARPAGSGTTAVVMALTSDGRLGIGTTPASTFVLDVNGQTQFRSHLKFNGTLIYDIGDLTFRAGTIYAKNLDVAPNGVANSYVSARQINLMDQNGIAAGSFNWGMVADAAVLTSKFRLQDNAGNGVISAIRLFSGAVTNTFAVDMNLIPNNEFTPYTNVGSGPSAYKLGAWSLGTGGTGGIHWANAHVEHLSVYGTVDTSLIVTGVVRASSQIQGNGFAVWDGSNPFTISNVIDNAKNATFNNVTIGGVCSGCPSGTGPEIPIDQHGADPTGVATSDAAWTAVVALAQASGGCIVFGPGLYRFTTTLFLGNGTDSAVSTWTKPCVIGQGMGGYGNGSNTKLKYDGAVGQPAVSIAGPGVTARLENLMIDGQNKASRSLEIYSASYSQVKNILTTGYIDWGFYVSTRNSAVLPGLPSCWMRLDNLNAWGPANANSGGFYIGGDTSASGHLDPCSTIITGLNVWYGGSGYGIKIGFADSIMFDMPQTYCVVGTCTAGAGRALRSDQQAGSYSAFPRDINMRALNMDPSGMSGTTGGDYGSIVFESINMDGCPYLSPQCMPTAIAGGAFYTLAPGTGGVGKDMFNRFWGDESHTGGATFTSLLRGGQPSGASGVPQFEVGTPSTTATQGQALYVMPFSTSGNLTSGLRGLYIDHRTDFTIHYRAGAGTTLGNTADWMTVDPATRQVTFPQAMPSLTVSGVTNVGSLQFQGISVGTVSSGQTNLSANNLTANLSAALTNLVVTGTCTVNGTPCIGTGASLSATNQVWTGTEIFDNGSNDTISLTNGSQLSVMGATFSSSGAARLDAQIGPRLRFIDNDFATTTRAGINGKITGRAWTVYGQSFSMLDSGGTFHDGVTASGSCPSGQAVKNITVFGGIVTAVTCGIP